MNKLEIVRKAHIFILFIFIIQCFKAPIWAREYELSQDSTIQRPNIVTQMDHGFYSFAFSHDGNSVVIGGEFTIYLYDRASGKQIRRFEGHTSRTLSIAFSPTDQYLLTVSMDKTARLWEVLSGKEIRRFEHPNGVGSATFSPDGKQVLIGCGDKFIRLYDVATGIEVKRWGRLPEFISSVVISPDNRFISAIGPEGGVYLLDAGTGQAIKTFTGHSERILSTSLSPDSKYILTGHEDGTCRLWEASTAKEIRRFKATTNPIRSVAFSPDGRSVLSGGYYSGLESSLYLWDIATGKQIRHYEGTWGGYVASLMFSPDGRFILFAAYVAPTFACVLDVATGNEVFRFKHIFKGSAYPIRSATFSPDGRFVLTSSSDKTARLWDVSTGKEAQRFEGHTSSVYSATFSSDGRSILTGSFDQTARLWDVSTGKEIRKFLPQSPIEIVAFSADSRFILTVWQKVAKLWDVSTGRQVRSFQHLNSIYAAKFSLNKPYILTGSSDDTTRLWNIATGAEIRRIELHPDGATAVKFSPDGRFLLMINSDRTLRLWDIAKGKEVGRFKGHSDIIYSADFSPDGRLILSGSEDATARLWNVATGMEEQRVQLPDRVHAVAFLHNTPYVFSSEWNTPPQLWNISTRKKVQEYGGNASGVNKVAFSPDGRYILTCHLNYNAYLWDTRLGKEIQVFKGHSAGIISANFSSDSRFLLTSSWDKTARLWNVLTGEEMRRFEGHTDVVVTALFSPDNQYVLTTGNKDETARLWKIATGKEVQRFEHEDLGGWPFLGAEFSPDGLFALTTEGRYTTLWDSASGREVRRFKGFDGIVGFSSDGRFILTAAASKSARLWDISTGQEVTDAISSHKYVIRGYGRISPENRLVGAIRNENAAVIWDVATGKELQRLSGHFDRVSSVAFSQDGKFVLTGSEDGTARVWSTSTWKELISLCVYQDGNWAVINPEGRYDTNNLEKVNNMQWKMDDDSLKLLPFEIYMRDYYEPRLLPRILGGETLKPIRPLASLNRAQPIVSVTKMEQRKDNPLLVSVTIEASDGEYTPRQGPARKSGIYDLRLFRDGQLVEYEPKSGANIQAYSQLGKQPTFDDELKVWRRITQFKPDPKTGNARTFTVRLPRNKDITEVEFSAYTFNDDKVKSETYRQTYKLPQPLKATTKGKAYLITIGVAASEDLRWNLFYPANDARRLQKDLYDRLSQQYEQVVRVPLVSDFGGVVRRYGDCVEKKPTREAIRTVMDLLAGRDVEPERKQLVPCADQIQKVSPEDLVIVSFSGHGYGDESGNYYLFPYDTDKLSLAQQATDKLPDELLNKLISSEELSAWMRDIDAGEFVMILDACQSEAATGKEFKPGPMGSRGLGQLAYDKSMRMIVATQADNQAVGVGSLSHGLLTYALLEGLRESKTQKLTVREWFEKAVERVPTLFKERGLIGNVQQPSAFDFTRRKESLILGRSN